MASRLLDGSGDDGNNAAKAMFVDEAVYAERRDTLYNDIEKARGK